MVQPLLPEEQVLQQLLLQQLIQAEQQATTYHKKLEHVKVLGLKIQVIIKPKPTVTVQSVTPKCIDASAVTLSATATPTVEPAVSRNRCKWN
jgi:hypothetical protein